MNYKEATREVILKKRKTDSLKNTISLARGILETGFMKDDYDFATQMHGEICETVLELLLTEYVKKRPECSMWKSVILWNRRNPNSNFCTEIDWILLTPECVYLFECKSYAGEKTLTGQGTLSCEDKKSCDVYRQSCIHRDTISEWIEPFVFKNRIPVIQMCIFNFSRGSVADKRSRASRIELPLLDESNLLNYLKQGESDIVWNVTQLNLLMKRFIDRRASLQISHLNYVKSLH